jgi:hypothetical protein
METAMFSENTEKPTTFDAAYPRKPKLYIPFLKRLINL